MLRALDRLGVVGTRVITRQQGRPASRRSRTSSRCLTKLADAGDSLAPGLNLLVSFPFPKEAAEIVRGDYANASIRVDINLEQAPSGRRRRRPPPTSSTCAVLNASRSACAAATSAARPVRRCSTDRPARAAHQAVQEQGVRRQPGLPVVQSGGLRTPRTCLGDLVPAGSSAAPRRHR